MNGFRIEVDDPWTAYLAEAEARARDMSPAFRTIAELSEQRVRNTFRLQEDPWGNPWAEWAHPEAMRKARERKASPGGSDMILFDSTALFAGIDREWGPTSASVSIGSEGPSKDYAMAHQFGVEGRNLPQRAMLPLATPDAMPELPAEWYDEIVLPLETYILGAFK